MSLKPCPPVDPALVEWLSQVYPDRHPDGSESERHVLIKAGAIQVVRLLRQELERQTRNSTKQEVIR